MLEISNCELPLGAVSVVKAWVAEVVQILLGFVLVCFSLASWAGNVRASDGNYVKGLEKFEGKPSYSKGKCGKRGGRRAWDWAGVGTWGHSVEISASAFLRGLKGDKDVKVQRHLKLWRSGGGGQGERIAEPGAREDTST